MEGEARWLRDRGYAVLVPMRRGRGASDGVYAETNCCDLEDLVPRDCSAGLSEALDDLHAAMGFGLRQPGVRPDPVLLAGVSRGGFLSIAYAGLHPMEVSGVISFVGGWTADWCNGDFNTQRLAEAGAGAKAPQLWLHAENDLYYGADHIRENHAAFTAAGGRAAMHMLAGVPHDGHRLQPTPTAGQAWRPNTAQPASAGGIVLNRSGTAAAVGQTNLWPPRPNVWQSWT